MATKDDTKKTATENTEGNIVGKLTVRTLFNGKVVVGTTIKLAGRVDNRKVKPSNFGDCTEYRGAFAGCLFDDKGAKVRVVLANRMFVPQIAEAYLSTVKDGEEFKLAMVAKKSDDPKNKMGYTFMIKLDAAGIASNPGIRLLDA